MNEPPSYIDATIGYSEATNEPPPPYNINNNNITITDLPELHTPALLLLIKPYKFLTIGKTIKNGCISCITGTGKCFTTIGKTVKNMFDEDNCGYCIGLEDNIIFTIVYCNSNIT